MGLSKIYLIDDASAGNLTNHYVEKLKLLQKNRFWDKYFSKGIPVEFEAFVRDSYYQNGNWEQKSRDESIGNNQYTKDFLNAKFKEALGLYNTIMLIDYYLIDNPTDETDVNALNYLREELTKNNKKMVDQRTRILFYSSWPSEKMIREIRKLKNQNIYYSGLDFQNEIDVISFDIEEYFRSVIKSEKNGK